jgi:imidazolonepropionase-like amidohydrolase
MLYEAENAYVTLKAGFTTVQSIGSPLDVDMRAAIARGIIPGPRLLTSIRPLNENSGTPDAIRALVRKLKADGADLVKLFASKSSREGGGQTMTDEQVAASCGEAKAVGLRTWVHAHSPSSIRAAVNGGCTTVTHGSYATNDELQLMRRAARTSSRTSDSCRRTTSRTRVITSASATSTKRGLRTPRSSFR